MNTPSHAIISHSKETAVLTLMGVVLLLTGTYAGVGWSGFVYGFHSSFPAGAGYARTILYLGVVLLIGARDSVSRRDKRLLLAAFGLTLVADLLLPSCGGEPWGTSHGFTTTTTVTGGRGYPGSRPPPYWPY